MMQRLGLSFKRKCLVFPWMAIGLLLVALALPAHVVIAAEGEPPPAPAAPVKQPLSQVTRELPGRVSLADVQFGPAVFKDNEWKLTGDLRTFNAGFHKDRLTLMIRFSYSSSRLETPLKVMIRMPDCRQYDDTITLVGRRGQYTYHFTIHNPEDFLGTGSIYLSYGYSYVEVLDFTIVPGT